MGKGRHYYNGSSFAFAGVTEADITLNIVGGSSGVANIFYAIKDSNDNVFVFCGNTTTSFGSLNIIKVDKSGNKTIVKNSSQYNGSNFGSRSLSPTLSRDESIIYCMMYRAANAYALYAIDTTTLSQSYSFGFTTAWQFAIYQDRYIWVASGSTVRIYDYDTKAELASKDISTNIPVVVCSTGNVLYFGYGSGGVQFGKAVFNGINTITWSPIQENITYNVKQLLIDKWGDLIILTNSGPASTLLKYTIAGVQIGTTVTLAGASYNLNTDQNGAYYYSTDLATYKVPANTAQGQAISAVGNHVIIRADGMTTYGNNITGYNPAVNGGA